MIVVLAVFACILLIIDKECVRFTWGYVYKEDINTFTLCSDGVAKDEAFIQIKKRRNFRNKMEGDFEWDDVQIKSITLQSDNSQIVFKCTTRTNEIIELKSDESLTFDKEVVRAGYVVNFSGNDCEPVKIDTEIQYDKKNMKPEYYVEVIRPMKKLTLRLLVHKSIDINNIEYFSEPLYGEYNKKPIKIKAKRSKDEPAYMEYSISL